VTLTESDAMATRPYSETLKEALRDPSDAAAYLEAALQEENAEGFFLALRTVAEVHGIAQVAHSLKPKDNE
jgi:DNA-binding phage protein